MTRNAAIRQTAAIIDAALVDAWVRQAQAAATVAGIDKELARLGDRRPEYAATRREALAAAMDVLDAIRDEIRDLDAIAQAGRWSRFVLVPGGHLHRGFYCPTLHSTTVTGLMPEYSGADEAEIVDLAGEVACTVCFPSAPVDRPTRIPSLVAEREAREAAAAEKAAKKAAAQAAQIVVGREVYKTQRAAENEIGWQIDNVVSRRYMPAQDAEHRRYLDGMADADLAHARRIAVAIGDTVQGYDADAILAKKFAAKVREYRKGGWDIPADATL